MRFRLIALGFLFFTFDRKIKIRRKLSSTAVYFTRETIRTMVAIHENSSKFVKNIS